MGKANITFYLLQGNFLLMQTEESYLSNNNPGFTCDIAITNFVVTHTCEIGFHDVIGRTIRMFIS